MSVDIEAYPVVADEADVRGLPTFVVYEGGEEVEQHLGVTDPRALDGAVTR